jgi:hypothetical protein
MPLEGHWARINTPIGAEPKRNVWVVGTLLALLVTAAIALLVVGLTRSPAQPAPPTGCIDVQIAGVMGSERFHPCGRSAIEACRGALAKSDPASATIVAACREQDLL